MVVCLACLFKERQSIYAQITSPKGDQTLVSASTLETSIRSGATGNKNAASEVGKLIAERAISVGIKDVSFDRSGYKYHGRVKALADSAREVGLKF